MTLIPHIIYEDPNLVVLDKPAGLLSQGEKSGDINLVDWLRDYLGRHYVGLVHRLDRNTSGIMVVAKRTKAAQRLTSALTSGKLERVYIAWLHGLLRDNTEKDGSIRWEHWLLKDEKRNMTRVVPPETLDAKKAILHVRGLRTFANKTLAEFRLETGRSHQIRAQAAASGHPLLGDTKYGAPARNLIARPALHSWKIKFPHPIGGNLLEFEAPPPADFIACSEPETP